MLKKILKFLWALFKHVYKYVSYLVALGFILFGLLIVTLMLVISGQRSDLTASVAKPLPAKDKDVYLYLNLENVSERSIQEPSYANLALNLGLPVPKIMSMTKLQQVFKQAATDRRIEGIFIDTDKANFETFAIATQVDKAIQQFKAVSKKPIYAFSNRHGLQDVVALQHADKIFIGEFGSLDVAQFEVSSYFLKDFFTEYGIKDFSYQAGKYGLFNLTSQAGFTPENNTNITSLVTKPFEQVLTDVNASRKLHLTPADFTPDAMIKYSYDFLSDAQYAQKLGYAQVVSLFNWSDFVRETAGVTDKTKAPKVVMLDQYLSDMQYKEQQKDKDDDSKKDYYLNYYYSGYLNEHGIDAQVLADRLLSQTVLLPEPKKDKKGKVIDNGEGKLKGIVLRLNSPGGTVGQAKVLYQALTKVRAAGVPVVVVAPDQLTGATFVGALGADAIVADKYAAVGGINAQTSLYDITDTLRAFYNINPSYFRATRLVVGNGSIPFPFSLVLKSNTAVLVTPEFVQYKHLVTKGAYDDQVDLLAQARKLTVAQAQALSQGIVYTASEAVANKLITRIGDASDAYAILDELNKAKDKKFNPKDIVKEEANPDYGSYNSILATINNELSAYREFKLRQEYNLSKAQYDALTFRLSYANNPSVVLDICFACDNKAMDRIVKPSNDVTGKYSFKLFNGF